MLKWKNAKEVLQEFTRKKNKTGLEKMCPSSRCFFSGIFGGILLAQTKNGSRTATFVPGPLGSGDLHSQKSKRLHFAMRARISDAQ